MYRHYQLLLLLTCFPAMSLASSKKNTYFRYQPESGVEAKVQPWIDKEPQAPKIIEKQNQKIKKLESDRCCLSCLLCASSSCGALCLFTVFSNGMCCSKVNAFKNFDACNKHAYKKQ